MIFTEAQFALSCTPTGEGSGSATATVTLSNNVVLQNAVNIHVQTLTSGSATGTWRQVHATSHHTGSYNHLHPTTKTPLPDTIDSMHMAWLAI